MSGLERREQVAAYGFLAPAFLFYLLFAAIPLLATIGFCFFTVKRIPLQAEFAGLTNFGWIYTDPRFWKSFLNTFYFIALAVVGNVGGGLILALLLNRALPRRLLLYFRLAYFFPVLVAAAFVSYIWKFLYAYDLGAINYYLRAVGLPGVKWLSDASVAMLSIAIMDVWKHVGFFMLILLAALQGVPRDILEAARIDGAKGRSIFLGDHPAVHLAGTAVLRDLRHHRRAAGVRLGANPDRRRTGRRYAHGGALHVRGSVRRRRPERRRDRRAHAAGGHRARRRAPMVHRPALGDRMSRTEPPQRFWDRLLSASQVVHWRNLPVMLALGAGSVLMLLPFLWMFSASMRPPAEAYKLPPSFLPDRLDLEAYRAVLGSSIPFLQMYWNSFVVAAVTTLGVVVTSAMAAFAFSRLQVSG